MEEIDRGFEGWDDMEEAYAFRYSGGGQPDLCKDVIVKIMVMADLLMVDAAPVDTESLLHLEIKLCFPRYPNFMSLIFNLHLQIINLCNKCVVFSLIHVLEMGWFLCCKSLKVDVFSGWLGSEPMTTPKMAKP